MDDKKKATQSRFSARKPERGQRRNDLGIDAASENLALGPRTGTADFSPTTEPGVPKALGLPTDETEELASSSSSSRFKGTSKLKLYTRRFLRNRMAVVGLLIFILLVFFALFGGVFAKWSFDDPDFLNLATGPSSEHWFGTDDAGNDLYAQTVHGLGRTLIIAVSVTVATTILSALIGAGAAIYGGAVEKVILTVIHFLLAIPTFLLIALLVADTGGDWKMLTFVLILFGWMYAARVIWSLALSIRENDYVRAASYMGVSRPKIVVRHIVPNIGSLLIIQFALGLVSTVMSETALSFLGLGVKMPDVSLGTLLAGGASALESSPWRFYFPAGVLTMLTVSMAYIADGLRDALDPNSNSGGKA